MESIRYSINLATPDKIATHLRLCSDMFIPPLGKRVDIVAYSRKIFANAIRFEAWDCDILVGFVAAYCNDSINLKAFITSVSVLKQWQGRGIASKLISDCILHVREIGFNCIELEVDHYNKPAIGLYVKHGFLLDNKTNKYVLNIR